MEEVNCYYCGSAENSFYAEENDFSLVKCNSCGLLFVNPRPSPMEIEQAQRSGVHHGARNIDTTGRFNRSKVRVYRGILRDFFQGKTSLEGIRWLDIGCGFGEFLLALNEFSDRKIICRGLEPNIRKQQSAQKRGLDVRYFDVSTHPEKYDVISFLNVYSHLENPVEALTSWRELLKPGGEILLETGDAAHLDVEDQYRPFYLPDHLSIASEEIVTGILRSIGFEIIDVRKYAYLKYDVPTITKELLKIVWPGKQSNIRFLLRRSFPKADMYIRARLKI